MSGGNGFGSSLERIERERQEQQRQFSRRNLLYVKYFYSQYKIIEFLSVTKFVEIPCKKCKEVIDGYYIQVADKIIDICDKDSDFIPTSEFKEKVINSPVVIKRLNKLLKGEKSYSLFPPHKCLED